MWNVGLVVTRHADWLLKSWEIVREVLPLKIDLTDQPSAVDGMGCPQIDFLAEDESCKPCFGCITSKTGKLWGVVARRTNS